MTEQKLFAELYDNLVKSEKDFLQCLEILSEKLSKKEKEDLKRKVLKKWFINEFPTLLPPNDEQCDAILDSGINTLVTARAGSGKTTLLVYRVLFLLRCRHIESDKILLLAFNKSAVVLIKERLFRILSYAGDYELFLNRVAGMSSKNYTARERVINEFLSSRGISLPYIMTFHAFAYRIVRPSAHQFQITDDVGSLNMNCFNEVLRRKLSDHKLISQYSDMLMHCFTGSYSSSNDSIHSVDGTRVDSFRDLELANFFFSCKISYSYVSRPIEHHSYFQIFNDPEQSIAVVRTWNGVMSSFERAGRQLITLGDDDFYFTNRIKENVKQELISDLTAMLGRQICEDDGQKVFVRCEYARERLLKSFQSLILMCKHRRLSPKNYMVESERMKKKSREIKLFCSLFGDFYQDYEQLLKESDSYDFLRLFERATTILKTEQRPKFFTDKLQYIMADEFQDFSTSYYELLNAVRKSVKATGEIPNNSISEQETKSSIDNNNRVIKLLAVGDNWQAINGYAGADVQYFSNFEKFFDQATRLSLLSNYRSEKKIISISNKLMEGLGDPAVAVKKEPGSVYLIAGSDKKDATSVLVRIFELSSYILNRLSAEETAVILVRTQNEAQRLRQNITSPLINIQTVHSFKGSEADIVVIDVSSWMFPLIHPDSVYAETIGLTEQMLVAEEKRLMYVALTRARKELYLVADCYENVSDFLKNLKFNYDQLIGEHIPSSLSDGESSWKQSVQAVISGKTYDVKEILKELGYRYNPSEKSWSRKYANAQMFESDFAKHALSAENINAELFDYTGKPISRKLKNGNSHSSEFRKKSIRGK